MSDKTLYNSALRFAAEKHEGQYRKGEEPDITETELALELLETAIYTSLRRVDVSTRYSSRQLVVILMDANAENAGKVSERIVETFEKLYTGGKIRMEYGIAQMDKNGRIAVK